MKMVACSGMVVPRARVDHVISGLPLPSFPAAGRDQILETGARMIVPGGAFRQITVMPLIYYRMYRRYFEDRSAVVTQHEAFGQLADEIRRLRADLERDKARLERLRSAGRIEDYNAGVDPFNAKVEQINELINRYNGVTQDTR